MLDPLHHQLASALHLWSEIAKARGMGFCKGAEALAAYDAAKNAYVNPMDGMTHESLMRCAANAMAKSTLLEDDNETLKAGISKRQNEINELKADLEKRTQQFKDALEIISGSQATAESSYQRAKMVGEERDALKAECAKMRDRLNDWQDTHTLIRVYRAAMRHRRALGTPVTADVAVVDFMCDFDNAIEKRGNK